MKKTVLILFAVLGSPVYAHDFLTEILVYNDDYEAGLYNVAVSYDLNEQDLLSALDLAKSKNLKSGDVKNADIIKPHSNHNHPGYVHLKKSKPESRTGLKPVTVKFNGAELGLNGLNSRGFDGNEKTCGVFDNFSHARSVAVDTCDSYALANPDQYAHGLVPQFIGPATFTDGVSATQNHHTNYQYEAGLQFNCVEVLTASKSLPGFK